VMLAGMRCMVGSYARQTCNVTFHVACVSGQ
jgi:hypothetical protein